MGSGGRRVGVDGYDVLQVITSASPRGAERYAVMLEPELVSRGVTVRTVALHPGVNPVLDVPVLGPERFARTTLTALRRACRSARVVIAHGSSTLPAVAVASFGTGVPFVYRNIGDPRYWASSRTRRWRTRLLLARASEVVALTPGARRSLAGCYGHRLARAEVIPNGVPIEQFPRRTPDERQAARQALGIPADRRVALCLGALSPEKGVPVAIGSLSHLPERWMLLVGGEGAERPLLERLASAVPSGRARLLGHVERPVEVLRAADVLVVPSLTEGLPGVIIEAAMVGLPAVATDTGFVREIIDHGVHGMVVAPGDERALAAAVLAAEPDLERMGAAARERSVREFSLSANADRWLAVIRRQVGGPEESPAVEAGGSR